MNDEGASQSSGVMWKWSREHVEKAENEALVLLVLLVGALESV